MSIINFKIQRNQGRCLKKRLREEASEDAEEGKSASTQAGEFVREEIHHVREGKHGARSAKQAIAIGLSKARRAGVKLGQPKLKNQCEHAREGQKGFRKKPPSRQDLRQTVARDTARTQKRAAHFSLVKGPS